MILAGSDVWWNDAADELREFVEMIESPVFLNAMGRGSIPADHPNLGSLGRRYGLVHSDTVILLGTPIDFRLGYGSDYMFPQNPKLIEIMMDGSKVGQNRDIDVGVVGNSKAILRQVMDELKSRGYRSPGKAVGRRGNDRGPRPAGRGRGDAQQHPDADSPDEARQRGARLP